MTTKKEIPQVLIDALPYGYTILGWGGDFRLFEDKETRVRYAAEVKDDVWEYNRNGWVVELEDHDVLYAAAAHSEIVELNAETIYDNCKEDSSIKRLFPTDAAERKTYPVGTFIKDYFPNAIAALAHHSYVSQEQHGPTTNGAPMEWLKDKSVGDGNQIIRHYMEGDYANMAWRALELLERELTNNK